MVAMMRRVAEGGVALGKIVVGLTKGLVGLAMDGLLVAVTVVAAWQATNPISTKGSSITIRL